MGYLDKYHRRPGSTRHALGEGIAYAGASYGFGYLQNRYRERAQIMGVPADLAVGMVAKVAAVFGGRYLKGFHGVVDTVANAGVGAFFHTMGSGHGGRASGLKRFVVPASDVDKVKKAIPSATILGEIPRQTQGAWLSTKDLAELSR